MQTAVVWFSMSSAISVLKFRNANLQFQKRNGCMQCVCMYVYDQLPCIVKVCVSQLFWSREVPPNTEVIPSQYFITSQRATRFLFPCYNRANLLFFFIYGVVKKPRYNRNLAISKLVVNGSYFHWTTHKRKRDRELCLVVSELVITRFPCIYTHSDVQYTKLILPQDIHTHGEGMVAFTPTVMYKVDTPTGYTHTHGEGMVAFTPTVMYKADIPTGHTHMVKGW